MCKFHAWRNPPDFCGLTGTEPDEHRPLVSLSFRCRHIQNLPSAGDLGSRVAARAERFGITLAVNDKVIQTENDYQKEVFNGDIGVITAIHHDRKVLLASFDGREVAYPFDDLDQLTLAYAITVHKSQGSEYPAVVVPLLRQHSVMLRRNLLYTAITRGRRLVVLVGEREAVRQAVTSHRGAKRWSKLAELLASDPSPGR